MKAKSIRTAIAAAFAVVAIAASCAGAGGTAVPNQAAGRMDAPVAGARVGFELTMAKRNGSTFSAAHMPCFNPRHKHAPGGGKTVSGTLAAREWRLVNPPHRGAAEMLGLTQQGVKYHLARLSSVLHHEGGDKGGRWVLGPKPKGKRGAK